GEVKAFVALGGNFVRAAPETAALEEAWTRLRLSVQISTKLNRNHLIPGEISYILPCLGRIEIDEQETGPKLFQSRTPPPAFTVRTGWPSLQVPTSCQSRVS
ncbi:MAG TPA: hypothetical protein VE420_03835, partial [Gemmatimonadales bacterium]|nr:hypothetical protein [Gemmatimonadales bacterium]